MSSRAALIWCPFPDEGIARGIVRTLLDERLIACGNLVPTLQSQFLWDGAVDSGTECGALLKTTTLRMAAAMKRLEGLHPYDLPAITGWAVETTDATLAWLERDTRPD